MININIINEEEENVGESGGYIHHTWNRTSQGTRESRLRKGIVSFWWRIIAYNLPTPFPRLVKIFILK